MMKLHKHPPGGPVIKLIQFGNSFVIVFMVLLFGFMLHLGLSILATRDAGKLPVMIVAGLIMYFCFKKLRGIHNY